MSVFLYPVSNRLLTFIQLSMHYTGVCIIMKANQSIMIYQVIETEKLCLHDEEEEKKYTVY